MLYIIFIIIFLTTHAFACDHATEKKQELSNDFVVIENDKTPMPSFEIIGSEIDALYNQLSLNKNIHSAAKFCLQMDLLRLKDSINKIKYIESPEIPRKDQSAKTKNAIDQAVTSATFRINEGWETIKKTITEVLK